MWFFFFFCGLVKFKWSFHVHVSVAGVGGVGVRGCHLLSRSQLKRLSALVPRGSSHKGSCLHTHTHIHLLIRRHTLCMYSVVRNDILTNTPKQLQQGQSPGPAGTDGVSWELTACPAAPMSHRQIYTHTHTLLRGCCNVGCVVSIKKFKKMKKWRHFSRYRNLSFLHNNGSVGG